MDEHISDDGPVLDPFDPTEADDWNLDEMPIPGKTDVFCPNCDGEGFVVIRVYPWDGCSYDDKPCELCQSTGYLSKTDYERLFKSDGL